MRMLRLLSGLSVTRLADLADIDRTTVWRLEKGLGHPQSRTADKLAAVLGCPVELLFPENEGRQADEPDAPQSSATAGPMRGG